MAAKWFGTVVALCAMLGGGSHAAEAPAGPTAFTGCTIYHDPDAPPIRKGTLVASANGIAAMGPDEAVTVPAGARQVPCNGAAILPAFRHSHVHFTGPDWQHILAVDAATRQQQLEQSYVRYGFVWLLDTGSELASTLQLKTLADVTILTSGVPFVPPNGAPFYVEDATFPELVSAGQARGAVTAALDGGADAIKLMTVPLTRAQPFPEMPLDVVKAVAETAHARGKPVLAHPTNRKGLEIALEGGVDVLMHTAPIGGPWDEALVRRMVQANMALTPTLALWDYEAAKTNDTAMAERFRKVSAQQLHAFASAGGRILFGTDAGYMTQYDPTPEYLAMQAAGLSFRQILASLTTTPAEVFEKDRAGGTLTAGRPASFVMVDGDPAEDIRRLAQVQRVYLRGREVYARKP